jgi:hypothetical protein
VAGSSGPAYTVGVVRVEPRPRAAAWLVGIGSVLMVIEGFVYGELGMLVLALVLYIFALLIWAEPHHHLGNGILVILLDVLSLVLGFGGFYVGAILVLVGGILAVLWSPPRVTIISVTSRPRS